MSGVKKRSNVEWAVEFATKKGWQVFPVHYMKDGACSCRNNQCSNPGKHPMTRNGFKDASSEVETILEMFDKCPDANIGVATGGKSGIEVVDVDPRNGGLDSYDKLQNEIGKFPATLTSKTGGGGYHYFFRYSGAGVEKNKLPPGIDFQSDGKYVIIPPSNHKSGCYEWMNLEAAVADTPVGFFQNEIVGNVNVDLDYHTDVIMEGARNKTLASIAGHLRSAHMEEHEIVAHLLKLNIEKCQTPLPEGEVKRIAQSISKYEVKATSTDSARLGKEYEYLSSDQINSKIKKLILSKAKMDFDALPLPLKKFREWATHSTFAPDEFIVLGCLASIAALMGKEYSLDLPMGDVKPHLWIACLAGATQGKTTALNISAKFLSKIEEPLLELRYKRLQEYNLNMKQFMSELTRKNSQVGSEKQPKYPSIRTLTLPPLTSSQKLIETLAKDHASGIVYVSSELSVLLSDWKADRNDGLSHLYMSLFDSPPIVPTSGYRCYAELPPIKNPSVSIIGASVVSSFLGRFSEEDLLSGNLQRWLLATTNANKPKQAMPSPKSFDGEVQFEQFFRKVFELPSVLGGDIRFKFGDEAKEYWIDIYTKLNDDYSYDLDDNTISCFERINNSYIPKFALIFECANQVYTRDELDSRNPTISLESMKQAIALARYFKDSLLDVLGVMKEGPIKVWMEKIVKELRRQKSKKLTESSLRTQINAYKRGYESMFEQALDRLRDLGIVYTVIEENGSNNTTQSKIVYLLES